MGRTTCIGMLAALLIVAGWAQATQAQGSGGDETVTLIAEGKAVLPLRAGTVDEAQVAELQRCLEVMSGTRLATAAPAQGERGVYVGLASDFPWFNLAEDAQKLERGGILIRSQGRSLLLIGKDELGVENAIYHFLHLLGCRWFFPTDAWEVIPQRRTIEGSWNVVHSPDYYQEAFLNYMHGTYDWSREELNQWHRCNGLAPRRGASHSWMGVDRDKDYEQTPEMFALVSSEYRGSDEDEERRPWQPLGPDGKKFYSKHHPCYTHPEVIRRGIEVALQQARENGQVGFSAPDWVNYCECERCQKVAGVDEMYICRRTPFGKQADGTEVSITSETYFRYVNTIAETVAEQYPGTPFSTIAYSCYAHPTSFKMQPSVYVLLTTRMARSPLSIDERLRRWGELAGTIGIYDYPGTTYMFYEWPDGFQGAQKPATSTPLELTEAATRSGGDGEPESPRAGGTLNLQRMQERLRFWHSLGARGYIGESAASWGSRGLGHYVSARLMWDVDADVRQVVTDFYDKAFGPAAGPMERYYVRWYGPLASASKSMSEDVVQPFNEANLRASFLDLDEAARLVADQPVYRTRIDQLRAYWYMLYLRHLGRQALERGDEAEADRLLGQEFRWIGRLARTHMVHTRGLFGLGSNGGTWRVRARRSEAEQARIPEGSFVLGDPPTREEIEACWEEMRRGLKL